MKKLIRILFLLILSLGILSCEKFEQKRQEKAKTALKEGLYKKYGEEFKILDIRKGRLNGETAYIMNITPTRFNENDSYYLTRGYVFPYDRYAIGSNYGMIYFLESGNKLYGERIEEIFGPNYICALAYDGGIDYINWEKEFAEQQKQYKEDPNGNFYPIRGGIYIFDRVQNDEDKERIREKIFTFVQYLKSIGNFEYTALWITIVDERVLAKDFLNVPRNAEGYLINSEDQIQLVELYEKIGKEYIKEAKEIAYSNPETFDSDPAILKEIDRLYHEKGEEYLKKREEIMSKYTEIYKNTSEEDRQKAIWIIRKNVAEEDTYHNLLLTAPLFSPKRIKINGTSIRRYSEYEEIKDILFTEENYYRGDINEPNNR